MVAGLQADRPELAVFDGTATISHHFVEIVMRRLAEVIF
jgi:hypothetical protein